MSKLKLNVVAFVRGKGSSMSPERRSPWVEVVPPQEVFDGYPGWGNDARIILQHIKQPSRWAIHTLYPPLETFVNGRVVLVGDAVGNASQAFEQGSNLFFRHMECFHTSAQV
jgi:salicylate hydroxylase